MRMLFYYAQPQFYPKINVINFRLFHHLKSMHIKYNFRVKLELGIRNFGAWLSPDESLAQNLWTSELLRTL